MDPAIPPVDTIGYVILAGTAGSRLFPLSEDLPKVLLSVANRPILWYILTALRRLGSCRVVVVTTGRFETQVKEVCCELVQRARTGSEVSDETKGECMASPSRHLQLVVDVLVVDEMLGSGGALKEALWRDATLSGCREVCVLAGDCLVGAAALQRLRAAHHRACVDCSLLLCGRKVSLTLKDVNDAELLLLDSEGHIAAKVSKLELDDDAGGEGDAEASLHLPRALFVRTPLLDCRSDLVDAHAYYFDGLALRAALAAPELAHATSLGADIVPYLAARYFQGMQLPPCRPAPASCATCTAIMANTEKITLPQAARGAAACIADDWDLGASDDDDSDDPLGSHFATRVRTIPTYVAVCRHVVAHAAASTRTQDMMCCQKVSLARRAILLGRKDICMGTLSCRDSTLVGDGTVLGEKVQLKHSTVGTNVRIGARCKINNSILLERVVLGDHCVVQNSIISADATLHERCNLNECQVAAGAIVPVNTVARQEVFLAVDTSAPGPK